MEKMLLPGKAVAWLNSTPCTQSDWRGRTQLVRGGVSQGVVKHAVTGNPRKVDARLGQFGAGRAEACMWHGGTGGDTPLGWKGHAGPQKLADPGNLAPEGEVTPRLCATHDPPVTPFGQMAGHRPRGPGRRRSSQPGGGWPWRWGWRR